MTLETETSVDTQKLLQILELGLTEDKKVNIRSRDSGKKLIEIMKKHAVYYLKDRGFIKEGEPINAQKIKEGFGKMVREGIETRLNAGVIFNVKPEESNQDLEAFRRSLTLADQLFFQKIFQSGECRRTAVFEELLKELIPKTDNSPSSVGTTTSIMD